MFKMLHSSMCIVTLFSKVVSDFESVSEAMAEIFSVRMLLLHSSDIQVVVITSGVCDTVLLRHPNFLAFVLVCYRVFLV